MAAWPAVETVEKVIAFYGHGRQNQYKEFSNFFWVSEAFKFILPAFARQKGFPEFVWCHCSEKAIMVTKAALMGDLESFAVIDAAKSPKECKSLGRKVRNFDDELWNLHLEEVAFEVVRQKFAANDTLAKILLSTGRAILAEAAANDMIWGIGLPATDLRANDPSQWRGRNILGFALMRVRDELGCTEAMASGTSANTTVPELVAESALSVASKAGAITDTSMSASCESSVTVSRSSGRRWGKTQIREGPLWHCENNAGNVSAASSSITSSECTFDCFAVLDFEATCQDGPRMEPQEIIELPIVLVHGVTGKILKEFRTYVRPVHHPQLTVFCTELTGIKQEEVKSAPIWSTALASAQGWLDGQLQEYELQHCMFVTCGDWDLANMIGRQCALSGEHVPARFRQWINIKSVFQKVVGKPARGMKEMLRVLGLVLEGHHHSGLDDSRNIARILVELLRRGGPGALGMDMVSSSTAEQARGTENGGRKGLKNKR